MDARRDARGIGTMFRHDIVRLQLRQRLIVAPLQPKRFSKKMPNLRGRCSQLDRLAQLFFGGERIKQP